MLKYSAKNYLLNAGLCRLCYADVDSLPATLDRYRDIDITFATSRECNLLENVTAALEAGDDQKFSDVVAGYDSLSKLVIPFLWIKTNFVLKDNWRTSMLWTVKHRIEERKAGAEDLETDLT